MVVFFRWVNILESIYGTATYQQFSITSRGAEYVDVLDETDLELCGYVKGKATYELYQDNRFSKDYVDSNNWSKLEAIKKHKM